MPVINISNDKIKKLEVHIPEPPAEKQYDCQFTKAELMELKHGIFMRIIDIERELYWKHNPERAKVKVFCEEVSQKVEKILEDIERDEKRERRRTRQNNKKAQRTR